MRGIALLNPSESAMTPPVPGTSKVLAEVTATYADGAYMRPIKPELPAAPSTFAHVLAGGAPGPGSYTTTQLNWYPPNRYVSPPLPALRHPPAGK